MDSIRAQKARRWPRECGRTRTAHLALAGAVQASFQQGKAGGQLRKSKGEKQCRLRKDGFRELTFDVAREGRERARWPRATPGQGLAKKTHWYI